MFKRLESRTKVSVEGFPITFGELKIGEAFFDTPRSVGCQHVKIKCSHKSYVVVGHGVGVSGKFERPPDALVHRVKLDDAHYHNYSIQEVLSE